MRRLSKKEKGFVKDIARGETGVQAILNNYDTTDYSTAGSMASENLKKPRIKQALEEALPDETLYQIHREGLFATKAQWIKEGGEYINVGEEVDHFARHKYLDSAYKLKGKYIEKHLNVNIDVEAKLSEQEEKLANELLHKQRAA